MSPILNFPQILLSEILADYDLGIKIDVMTIVTPNRRLATALKREFDRVQTVKGVSVWDSADILPVTAFVERLYEDALYSDGAPHLPILLTPAQEQVLWEKAISHSAAGAVLHSVAEAARLAREAWQLAHAWNLIPRLRNFPLNEDGRAFRDWSQFYEQITARARQIDRARLHDLVSELCQYPEVSKPKRLICYGFDIVTPQLAALLIKLEEYGCEVMLAPPSQGASPPESSNPIRRVAYDDRSEEIYHAAVWARERIEADGQVRIGVVVPGFSEHRSTIMRIFNSVMEPDVQRSLPGTAGRIPPFNASLGLALTSYPLVNAAFLILELGAGEIEFERASILLRSPFIGGGETEMIHRARLDAQLRKRAAPMITLERLLALIEREPGSTNCPVLVSRLSVYDEFRKTKLLGSQAPSMLARAILEVLRIVGFPGERDLDSVEYQTVKKWQEVLADFAVIDNVMQHTGYGEALSRLRHMAADTLFQPETPDVPIQILGVFEAAGMAFDHLWVMGLSDEAWPPQPRPNPFLPIELQRAERLPQGSADSSLELARRLTDAWLTAAKEVILSHPRHGGDHDTRELSPSPLIADIVVCKLVLPDYASHHDFIHDARRLERLRDDEAPPMRMDSAKGVTGGMAVIRDQAVCPFRALAVHRLGAEGVRAPRPGLDAMERGTLVHHVLAQAWGRLKTRSALDTISDEDLEAVLMRAAEAAVARIQRDRPAIGRLAAIEQRRLMRLGREWLNEDKKRDDFTVVAIEDKRNIDIGGLALATRLDRVDELGDGRRLVIDYKTRAPSVSTMLGDRPEEPQLPLYLVAAEPDAVAVAFAQVKTGEMRFTLLVRDSDLLPGAKAFSESRHGDAYGSWEGLVAAWGATLERLAVDFIAGHAKVDPKKYPHTCRNCDVRSLCRIHERAGGEFTEQGGGG
ncbi:PD-(D/E)XK nuclease family protein [Nitrosovibrio sp. Nv6]|uniref:PD-(D/E)XK nuclease family protein n=1 Tax=Nitrosovibrio sp. Nv6 TaxID=1855340 RepID=UPI0008B74ADC|nr:PD-(D/E)XK nuclease family protein [Nitrosovibrio sp. Nv6]SEP31067.1 probable DNA repair protein [Nitrosovibrio sp. Nv6]